MQSCANVSPAVRSNLASNLLLTLVPLLARPESQVKFSELTLDMFRMLQLLEREPQEEVTQVYDASGQPIPVMPGRPGIMASMAAFNENGDRMSGGPGHHGLGVPPHHPMSQQSHLPQSAYKRENPHKYLLYRPSFSQLLVFLASGFKELPANGVLLLYLSADGVFANIKHPEDCE